MQLLLSHCKPCSETFLFSIFLQQMHTFVVTGDLDRLNASGLVKLTTGDPAETFHCKDFDFCCSLCTRPLLSLLRLSNAKTLTELESVMMECLHAYLPHIAKRCKKFQNVLGRDYIKIKLI